MEPTELLLLLLLLLVLLVLLLLLLFSPGGFFNHTQAPSKNRRTFFVPRRDRSLESSHGKVPFPRNSAWQEGVVWGPCQWIWPGILQRCVFLFHFRFDICSWVGDVFVDIWCMSMKIMDS